MSGRTVIRGRDKTGQPPVLPPVVPQAVFVAPEPQLGPPVPKVRSGFCRIDAPEWSHKKCRGRLGTAARPADCKCECHGERS